MAKLALLSVASLAFAAFHGDTNATAAEASKKEDIKEKVLFKGKDYYDKRLQKKYEKKQESNSSHNIKVYKRKDGSIDSWKTYNESKK